MSKKIRGGEVASINALRSSLKKGSSDSTYLKRIPSDASLTVRFLTEPTEWIAYYEYYDAEQKRFFPAVEGVQTEQRPAARYLANALDISENRVIPLVMPKSVAASLLKKYDKYATLIDRDYELSRSGSGLDTEYDVTPEPPTKVNISRYELLDLMGLLESQLEDVPVNDEDDEEELIAKPSKAKVNERKSKIVEEDEDEDDEDEDADDEESSEESLSRDDLEEKSLAELKLLAREKGLNTKGLDSDSIIDLLVGEADDDDDDESESTDDDSEDEDEEIEEITEEKMQAMSLKELKELAAEFDIRVKAGTSKEDIIEMILDAAEELEDDEDDEDKPPF